MTDERDFPTLKAWPRTVRCGECGYVATTSEEASAILAGVGCKGHGPFVHGAAAEVNDNKDGG